MCAWLCDTILEIFWSGSWRYIGHVTVHIECLSECAKLFSPPLISLQLRFPIVCHKSTLSKDAFESGTSKSHLSLFEPEFRTSIIESSRSKDHVLPYQPFQPLPRP